MNDKMYDELVQGLLSVLSDKTVQIVLYGSTARGTAQPVPHTTAMSLTDQV